MLPRRRAGITRPLHARVSSVTCRPRGPARTSSAMNWQAFAVPAALIVALLCGCAHEPTRQPRAPGAQPTLRLMTYNVNFGIPGDEPTLAAIARGDADVVFLQEINAAWERELRAHFGRAYPHL